MDINKLYSTHNSNEPSFVKTSANDNLIRTNSRESTFSSYYVYNLGGPDYKNNITGSNKQSLIGIVS